VRIALTKIFYQLLQEKLGCFKNGCEITIRKSLEVYGVFHEYLAAVATSVEVFALGDGKGTNGAPVWGLRTLARTGLRQSRASQETVILRPITHPRQR
jgi:hypothetical protein